MIKQKHIIAGIVISNFIFFLLLFAIIQYTANKHISTSNIKITDTFEHNALSSIISAESGPNTRDTLDAYLVGSTVLNRADHTEFPNAIFDVIREQGQYDGYCSDNYYRTPQSDSIAVRLMEGNGRNYRVLFFCTKNINMKILDKYKVLTESTNHKFYGIY